MVANRTATRPTTCAALFAAGDHEHADQGCKRLPRHDGDHRPFLTIAAEHRAAKKAATRPTPKPATKPARKRVTWAQRERDFRTKLASDLAAGTISAGDALAKMAAHASRATKPARSRPPPDPVTHAHEPSRDLRRSPIHRASQACPACHP